MSNRLKRLNGRHADPGALAETLEQLLRDPEHRRRVAEEIRAVAEEVAADPRYAEEQGVGPDEAARARFREFVKSRFGA